MRDLAIIHKILTALRDSLDDKEPELGVITSDRLHISDCRWRRYMKMLIDKGLISGAAWENGKIKITDLCITLDGLEYLEENPAMLTASRYDSGVRI